jgi:hypothetical protein
VSRLSRRKFLAFTGLAGLSQLFWFDPIRQLASTIARSTSRSDSVRNYVQFNLYGAPSRWFFDQVLRPSDADEFVPAAGMYNRIDEANGLVAKGSYRDVNIRGLNMPHLWAYDVAIPGGGKRPMADLMDHMLIIRGCDIRTNGHPLANFQQVRPSPFGPSLTGLVADASVCPIPAICVGRAPAADAYLAPKGTSLARIPHDHPDYISFLLEPFSQGVEGGEEAADRAAKILAERIGGTNPSLMSLCGDRQRAGEMLRKGFSKFAHAFGPLVRKYDDLFHRSLHLTPVEGVTDRPIPGALFPFTSIVPGGPQPSLAAYYLDRKILCGGDLREIFLRARCNYLAKQFAIAEFALTERLSSSILLTSPNPLEQANYILTDLDPFEYVRLDELHEELGVTEGHVVYHAGRRARQQRGYKLLHDAHETGWLVNTISCTMFFRGFASCLSELIERLKATHGREGESLFEDTVIQVASEFDRYPRSEGANFTHSPRAHVTSFFSGLIREPAILGNIKVGNNSQPAGTMGFAAPVRELGAPVSLQNISSTVSEMVGVAKINPDAQALVSVHGSSLEPAISPGKNLSDES